MCSSTKIAGQLRKNSSGHATRSFAKKSRKFEIPAVRLKEFYMDKQYCLLLNILGDTSFSGIKLIY